MLTILLFLAWKEARHLFTLTKEWFVPSLIELDPGVLGKKTMWKIYDVNGDNKRMGVLGTGEIKRGKYCKRIIFGDVFILAPLAFASIRQIKYIAKCAFIKVSLNWLE